MKNEILLRGQIEKTHIYEELRLSQNLKVNLSKSLSIHHLTIKKIITSSIEKCNTSMESCFQGYNFEL
jgi:hypothetical protein